MFGIHICQDEILALLPFATLVVSNFAVIVAWFNGGRTATRGAIVTCAHGRHNACGS